MPLPVFLFFYIPWALFMIVFYGTYRALCGVFYVAGQALAFVATPLRRTPLRVLTVLAFLLGFPVPVWFIALVLLSLVSVALATPWSF
jgi:hypothetical protein